MNLKNNILNFLELNYDIKNLNDSELIIENLFVDSRQKLSNSMFFCIKGMVHDSHNYIQQAIENGAVCIVHEQNVNQYIAKYKNICFIRFSDTRLALAKIAQIFNYHPTKNMNLYAVTGTNGKTSVSYLIYKILSKLEKSAYNGTAGTIIGGEVSPYTHLTTPDTLDLVNIFKDAKNSAVKSFSMEVSSHALDMKRAYGIDIDIAIYTNLSRDHLDYHGTMEEYKKAKAVLFNNLKREGIAVINEDDKESDYFKKACLNCKYVSYGKSKNADYSFDNIKLSSNSIEFRLCYDSEYYQVKSNLISEINVYNLTAVIAAIHQGGKDLKETIKCAEDINFNIGRFQYVKSSKYSILVDYAHTPDGFEKIFAFTDTFRVKGLKIISVFGSAGKRDRGKRPIMGKIASEHSDIIVLTEEDYRDEDPIKIANDITKGFISDTQYFIEVDREKAIKLALEMANQDDVILILGKGVENFLDRGDESEYWAKDDVIASKYAEI